jgi:ABC-type glycerol-3-phosphate transport system permease component
MLRRTVARALLWASCLLVLVPLYFIFSAALRSGGDYAREPGGLPGIVTIDNFRALVEHETFYRWLANSMLLTGVSVAVSLVVSSLAAHALTSFGLPGASLLLRLVATLMAVPLILLIVPLFVEFSALGLIDTYTGAIAIYSTILLPFSIFLLARFFAAVPRPLLEAARVEGAGPVRLLVSVLAPSARSALVAVAVVNSFFIWNDLLIALVFLQSDAHRPLMVGITTLAGRATDQVPLTMAALTLSLLPIVALYAVTQRGLVRGLAGGGLRGE